jgi:hypothetical protein
MNFEICDKCDKHAIWFYPGGTEENKAPQYCDDCVPRGCSCNVLSCGVEAVDDDGRLLPCCDYMYFENGIDKDVPLMTDEQVQQLDDLYAKLSAGTITEDQYNEEFDKIIG